MSRGVSLFDAPGGTLVRELSGQVRGCQVATGPRGVADLAVSIAAPNLSERIRLATRIGTPDLRIGDGGHRLEGRLEGAPIAGGETVELTAYGYHRALSDIPYTALWSDSTIERWRVEEPAATWYSARFTADNQNRLSIAPKKNAAYAFGDRSGAWRYVQPSLGSRQIVGIQFAYTVDLTADYRMDVATYNEGYAAGAGVFTSTGTGAAVSGAMHLTFAARDYAVMSIVCVNGAGATYAGEDGADYARLTNIRLVTSTTNRVNTTLTVGRTNGAAVTCTVGSIANIYAGMQLVINSGTAVNSEIVTVIAVTGATTFTANVVAAPGGGYAIGTTVQGFAVYADEVVRDMQSAVVAANPTQLNAATALIQSPGFDLVDALYEDAAMDAVLDELAALGDNQTTPRLWNWRVARDRVLVFEPRGSAARAWYADVADGDLEIDLATDQLITSAYPLYQEASGRVLRGAATTNAAALARYGLTRRAGVPTQTTNATIAGITRDTYLTDRAQPIPRIKVVVRQIFDSTGAPIPLDMIDAGRGDTLTIRNLAIGISTDLDRLRTFRIVRTSLDMVKGVLTCEAESPPATLEALLSRGITTVDIPATRRNAASTEYIRR